MADHNNQYQVVVTNTLNGTTASATSSAATLTVGKATQAGLTLSPTTGTFGSPLTLTTSGGTTGTAATYVASVGTATGCTISGSTLTVLTAGTCSVTATMAGGDNYNDVSSAATTVTFGSATQTITFGALTDKTYGVADFTITATSSSSLTVTFTTANSAICTVSGATLSLKSVGTCTVHADQAGNADYSAATRVTQAFSIAASALATPAAPSATAASTTSITVTFITVANASSYTVHLYLSDGSTLVGSARTSFTSGTTITGLTAATDYKLTVTAIGDNSHYSSSAASNLSDLVTTQTAALSFTISTQPTNATSAAGTTATFSVTATANGTLTYQWQISTNSGSTWSSVSGGSGATTSSYTTATIATSNNGYRYRVYIVNTLNGTTTNATSNAASLTVPTRSGVTTFAPTFDIGVSNRIYMQSTVITATTSMSGKVAFSVSGRPVPGCTAVKTTGIATCTWKPSSMGNVTITAVFTPTDAGYAIITRTLTIKVSPK